MRKRVAFRMNRDQSKEATEMAQVTLVMGEELASLRLYADQLRARLAGTVTGQIERFRHTIKQVSSTSSSLSSS